MTEKYNIGVNTEILYLSVVFRQNDNCCRKNRQFKGSLAIYFWLQR